MINLPPTRKHKKLGDICQIKTGRKDANYGTNDGQYPFFTCGKEVIKAPDFSFDTEAILIAGNGDVGACKYYKGKFEAYQRTYVVDEFTNDVSIHYVFHLLNGTLRQHAIHKSLGSAIPYIKLGVLKNFPILLPPLATQKAIVAKLDEAMASIDNSIALTEENIAKCDEMWESTLNQSIKESGYPKVELSEVSKLSGGGTPKTEVSENRDNGNVLRLTPTDLGGLGELVQIRDTNKKITELGLNNSSAKLMPPGTVFFSSRASIGKIGISEFFVSTNQGFANFECEEKILNRYLIYVLMSHIDEITQLSNSTTFKEVSKSSLKQFKIPLPSLDIQHEIVERLDTIGRHIKEMSNKYINKKIFLVQSKSSILNDAFTGKLVS